jgi:hypothetical protein
LKCRGNFKHFPGNAVRRLSELSFLNLGTQEVDFFYKCDDEYSPKDEISVRWNDPAILIDWRISNPTLSAKDATAPHLAEINNLARYGEV